MWYKYVKVTGRGWWNSGIVAYGQQPNNTETECWVRPWENPNY